MGRILFFVIFGLFAHTFSAQTVDTACADCVVAPDVVADIAYTKNTKPVLVKYPANAVEKEIQGTVIVKFIVNVDGTAQNFSVLKGIGYGCDEAAIWAVKRVKKWKPAQKNGIPVRSWKTFDLNFSLDK